LARARSIGFSLVKLYAPVTQALFQKWNIPWNIPWNMKMSEMEYSKKNVNKHKIEIFGIWNIAGILGFSIVI